MGGRQLHDLASWVDLDDAGRVALFVQIRRELVAPPEDQPLRFFNFDNFTGIGDAAISLPRFLTASVIAFSFKVFLQL
jgi:hypothetical protein